MRLWTNGDQEGHLLVAAETLERAGALMGIAPADLRGNRDLPLEVLRQELGEPAALALGRMFRLLVLSLRSEGLQVRLPEMSREDRAPVVEVPEVSVVFLTGADGERVAGRADDLAARVGQERVVARRTGGHWVREPLE